MENRPQILSTAGDSLPALVTTRTRFHRRPPINVSLRDIVKAGGGLKILPDKVPRSQSSIGGENLDRRSTHVKPRAESFTSFLTESNLTATSSSFHGDTESQGGHVSRGHPGSDVRAGTYTLLSLNQGSALPTVPSTPRHGPKE